MLVTNDRKEVLDGLGERTVNHGLQKGTDDRFCTFVRDEGQIMLSLILCQWEASQEKERIVLAAVQQMHGGANLSIKFIDNALVLPYMFIILGRKSTADKKDPVWIGHSMLLIQE